ncbi:hypothetical protein MBT84_28020 [Streptomyces sp. MBT84]|uniref:hypothetical protein n=1 Tax=unclassified Streptomyces TaxID=2593676 RepID=UPI001C6EDD9F|nr:hypothetical protein [Streptomyces sp. MBT84]MBW8703447.1 hypothetical protein [Streptomyces sp. MBT84]
MNHPGTEAEPGTEHADTGRLREALAEAAYDITPSHLPLAAVERRGRRIRRRRGATVIAAGCGLLLVSLALVTLRGTSPDTEPITPPAASTPAPSASSAAPAPAPRIVAPGEQVAAAPGFRLWLTAEGEHWTVPTFPEPQFRSVVDGNIDPNTPGVSLQSETNTNRAYLSGLYYGGKGTASTVEIQTQTGTVHGKLIELPGHPGWGVWYATTHLEPDDDPVDFVSQVTVHDTEGRIYARLKAR